MSILICKRFPDSEVRRIFVQVGNKRNHSGLQRGYLDTHIFHK